MRVHPTLVPERELIASVNGVMNAVLVKGDAVGRTLYNGPGAGAEPTASAVVADLVDVVRALTTDPDHRVPHLAFRPDALTPVRVLSIEEAETAFYLKMLASDRPGVLAEVATIFGEAGISIEAVVQPEAAARRRAGEARDADPSRAGAAGERGGRAGRGAAGGRRRGDMHPDGALGRLTATPVRTGHAGSPDRSIAGVPGVMPAGRALAKAERGNPWMAPYRSVRGFPRMAGAKAGRGNPWMAPSRSVRGFPRMAGAKAGSGNPVGWRRRRQAAGCALGPRLRDDPRCGPDRRSSSS